MDLIDLSYYEKVAEGDKEFVERMMQTFLEDVPLMIKAIRAAFEDGDVNLLKKQVHKLKPSWTMSGLDPQLLTSVDTLIMEGSALILIQGKILEIEYIAGNALKEMHHKLKSFRSSLN